MGLRRKNKEQRRKNRQLKARKKATPTADSGIAAVVEAPDDSKVLLKTVPAKVDGEVVGDALLYDDGSVDVILNRDISEEAKNKLNAAASELAGYSIGGTD